MTTTTNATPRWIEATKVPDWVKLDGLVSHELREQIEAHADRLSTRLADSIADAKEAHDLARRYREEIRRAGVPEGLGVEADRWSGFADLEGVATLLSAVFMLDPDTEHSAGSLEALATAFPVDLPWT